MGGMIREVKKLCDRSKDQRDVQLESGCIPGRKNNRLIWLTERTCGMAKLKVWREMAEDQTRKLNRGLI